MNKKLLSKAVSVAILLGLSQQLLAQEESVAASEPDDSIELVEILTIGRLRSAVDDVMVEREENPVVADFIDSSTIGRVGDSTVAAALRRVPGVTLVDDKFVFVRGLGERYSTSLLNGAHIPSPDLTRNVIPLDIFPTSIIKSIAVQKGYSADMPASFSGGLIDIRTLSIPKGLVFQVELGSGYNSESSGDMLSYHGGDDDWLGTDDGTRAFPDELHSALDLYKGSLDPLAILEQINLGDGTLTVADAQEINRNLALALNRDIDVVSKSTSPDLSVEANVGNNFYFDNGMEVGFLAAGAYSDVWRSRNSIDRVFGDPEEIFSEKDESTNNVNLTGNVGLGWRWFDDHSLQASSLFLRNTDNSAFIKDIYTSSFPYSEGSGFRNYGTRFEQRELKVNQLSGSHRFGGVTRDLLHFDAIEWLDDLKLEWFYSDSESTTDIPGESTVSYKTTVDPLTDTFVSQSLQSSATSGDFRYTDLTDEVESYGWDVSLPLYLKDIDVTLKGGYAYNRKTRQYQQTQFGLGTSNSVVASQLTGLTSEVFSDSVILDPSNQMAMNVIGSNGESYLAATTNDAVYGSVDATWNETWRAVVGVRWEDYAQVGLPWDPLEYTDCQISCDPDVLAESVFKDDDYYPSVALTYMRPEFWAETYQLRFGYSETVVRPDLREITPSSYIDPITGAYVSGNPDVVPASVKNYDLRSEWFFSNGDNFTASLFYKDIIDPIDMFESAAFEEALASEIINAESAEVYGLELEFLKEMSFLGEGFDSFFVAGNITLLDSELVAGDSADAPTNPTRPLAGASDAVNIQLGYDSFDGMHSAMLIYNVYGERLYFSGRNGTPDAYEQPFHSLDLTYFFYPTDNWVIKLAAKNLLDESVEIQQAGVTTFVEKPGTSVGLDIKWRY